MSKCRECGAEVRWIKTPQGRWMICDMEGVPVWPNQHGIHRAVLADGQVIACDLAGEEGEEAGIGFIPHWATCPARSKFKKKRADNLTPSLF